MWVFHLVYQSLNDYVRLTWYPPAAPARRHGHAQQGGAHPRPRRGEPGGAGGAHGGAGAGDGRGQGGERGNQLFCIVFTNKINNSTNNLNYRTQGYINTLELRFLGIFWLLCWFLCGT